MFAVIRCVPRLRVIVLASLRERAALFLLLLGASGGCWFGDLVSVAFGAILPPSHSPMLRLTLGACVSVVEGPAMAGSGPSVPGEAVTAFLAGVIKPNMM